MNPTMLPPESAGQLLTNTNRVGGLAFGIGISIGILILVTIITLTSYYCTRNHTLASPRTNSRTKHRERHNNGPLPVDTVVVEVSGLNKEVIESFPRLHYEEVKMSYNIQNEMNTTSSCSICLVDYKGKDMIRVLSGCYHLFHDDCVDLWLRHQPTCPLCRTSPLPSPEMTARVDDIPFFHRAMDI